MRPLFRLLPVLALVAACGQDKASSPAAAKSSLLTPPRGHESLQLVESADNPLTEAKAELGKQLFFDPRLSGTGKTSCSSCHLPEQAFTDGRQLSPQDSGKLNTRNSPTMYNVGYLERLYWDGRAKGLEANVLAAWKAQTGADPKVVSERLSAVPAYQEAFTKAFSAPPSETTIVHALASFLRSLRSGDSNFDRYQAGDKTALTEAQQQGMQLFLGKAGCVVCHTPPLFTNKLFHNVGIGMAKENPDLGANAKNALGDAAKPGSFKTPTLRDIQKTGPYFHDGSVATLRDAVALMAKGGLDNPHKDPLLANRNLTDAELDQLVAFLESLTGNQPFTPPTLPN